jgi:hypothetical protein
VSWLQALRDALPAEEREGGVHPSPPPPASAPESVPTRGNGGFARRREPPSEPPAVNPPTPVDPVDEAWWSRRRILWPTRGGDVIDATTLMIDDPRHDGERTTPYVLVASGWDRDDVLDLVDPAPEPETDEPETDDVQVRGRERLDHRVRWLLERLDQAPLDAPIVVNRLAHAVQEKFAGMSESTARRLARQARDILTEETEETEDE